jgi:hypothetical protein
VTNLPARPAIRAAIIHRMPRGPTLAGVAAIATTVLGLAGCGEEVPTITIKEGLPGGADPKSVRVIEDWAGALADGKVEKAASYFALPSVVANGAAPLRIRDRHDAETFNESLPCGAELVEAQGHGGFILVTFELTERPGPGRCGSGTGEQAGTAFRIEDGEIAEWRRIPVPGEGDGAEPLPSDVV